MTFSDFLENALLNHAFKNTAYTQPTNLYVGLFTAAPNDAGGGTEVTGNGYARVNHNAWDTATAGATENTGAVTFAAASGGNWGTVSHIGIFDALTGGNLICHGALTTAKAVNDGDTAEFADGAIDITLD